MAEDKDLDITRVKGTGGNDRITKLDIQRVESEGYDYEGEAGTSDESVSSTAQNVDVSSIGEGLNQCVNVLLKICVKVLIILLN